MEYKGKLYGKIGKTYIEMQFSADDVDTLKAENDRLRAESQRFLSGRERLQAENERLRGELTAVIEQFEKVERLYSRDRDIIEKAKNALK